MRTPHLKVRLLEDPGQLCRAVVFNLEAADVAQDFRHQLHVVVLHRLQLHFLQLFVSLGGDGEAQGGWVDRCSLMTVCHVRIYLDAWMKE